MPWVSPAQDIFVLGVVGGWQVVDGGPEESRAIGHLLVQQEESMTAALHVPLQHLPPVHSDLDGKAGLDLESDPAAAAAVDSVWAERAGQPLVRVAQVVEQVCCRGNM